MVPIWVKINGTTIQVTEPQQIIPLILSTITNLQYWSYESLRNLYIGIIDLVAEFCQYRIVETAGATRGKYTRLRNSFWKALKFTPNNREKMILKLYDMILSGEGLSRMHGYGTCTKFGDNLLTNPETTRMSREYHD